MAVAIPFPLPATGYALNSKVRVNLDFLVAQFNEFNSGSATWDTVAIGTPNDLTGVLTFYNDSNANYLSIQPGATSANITYTLPVTNPTVDNSILRVTTAGVMSWSDYSFDVSSADNGLLWISSGVNIDALVNSQGTAAILVGSAGGTPKWVQLAGTSNQISVAFNLNDVTLSTPQNLDTSANFQVSSIRTGAGSTSNTAVRLNAVNTGFYMNGASTIGFVIAGSTVAELGSAGDFAAVGEVRGAVLRCTSSLQVSSGANSTITITSGASSPYSLTLPVDDGNSGEILSTNGSGVLSWVSTSAAGAANQALSNLVSVAINTTLVSDTDNTDDLGTTSINWRSLYIATSIKNGSTTLATVTELGYLTGVTSAIQTQFSGKASTALSNLASVAINTTLVSDTNNTDDLGTSSIRWKTAYLATSLDISATSDQIVLGTTRTVTITAPTPATSSRTITFPDLSGDYSVVGTIAAQSIGGVKTFTDNPVISKSDDARVTITDTGDSSTLILRSDGSNTSIGTSTSTSFLFITGGSTRFTVNTSNQLLSNNGTTSAPVYAPSGNPSIGMYFGSNTIGFNVDTGGDIEWRINEIQTILLTASNFLPVGAGTVSTGTASNYWNDISYKTLTDRGCLPWCDDGVELVDGRVVSDLDALCAIKKHPFERTIHGLPKLDYRTFPKEAYRPAAIDGVLLPRDEKNMPIGGSDGVEMTMMFGVMIGAFKQVKDYFITTDVEIASLKTRIEELEKKKKGE